MQGAIEVAHMWHPDLRANVKIFATLYPDGHNGMVKLTSEQQAEFVAVSRGTFVPASGAWGRQGCTTVVLRSVEEAVLGEAMTLAWQNTTRKIRPPARDGGVTRDTSVPRKRPARGPRRKR